MGSFLIVAGLAPIPYRYWVSPPNQVYDGTEFWSDDYSAYVSYIIQGQQGKWLAHDTHTAEPGLPGIIIHGEYVWWGELTGFLGISPAIAYHLLRFILGSILLFLVWRLITLIFSSSKLRLTAYFLTLFVGGFPNITVENGKEVVNSLIPWLTELDVFYRFASLPHYLFGNIFFITCLILWIRLYRQTINPKNGLVFLVLAGIAMGFTHAVSLVTLYAVLGISLGFRFIIDLSATPKHIIQHVKSLLPEVSRLIVFLLLTAPLLIYFKSLLQLLPWSQLSAAWEASTQYYVPPKEIFLAIGPVAFLALPGLAILLSQRAKLKYEYLLLFSWPVVFFLFFYFSHPFLQISQVRFFQSYAFIGLSVISAPVFLWVADFINRRLRLRAALPVLFFLVFLALLPTLPLFSQSFIGRFTFYSDFNALIYPPKDWATAIWWLRDNTDHNAVVLGAWQAGHHIPFMAGNYVYYGHGWGTLNLKQKQDTAAQFYTDAMSVDQARQFLKNNFIDYVFYGYEERGYGGTLTKYAVLLQPAYSTPGVAIYRVL
jgi:hypothetical protein